MGSMLRTRSVSSGVRPVVGSVVTSPTVKIPNCISRLTDESNVHAFVCTADPTGETPHLFPDRCRPMGTYSVGGDEPVFGKAAQRGRRPDQGPRRRRRRG